MKRLIDVDDNMKLVAGKCPIEVGGNCPLKSQGEGEDSSPVISTKMAIATDGWGHELEGYYDESRQLFFSKAISREFLISTGWNIKLEEKQLRGETDGGEE